MQYFALPNKRSIDDSTRQHTVERVEPQQLQDGSSSLDSMPITSTEVQVALGQLNNGGLSGC